MAQYNLNDKNLDARYIAESAVEMFLSIYGIYRSQTISLHHFDLRTPGIVRRYEINLGKAVEIAALKFQDRVETVCGIMWNGFMEDSAGEELYNKEVKLQNLIVSSKSFLGDVGIHCELFFIYLSIMAEFCVRCYNTEQQELIPGFVDSVILIIMELIDNGSLNVIECLKSFLRLHAVDYNGN